MPHYIYLIAAVLCFVGEMFTMEFSLSCIGIGLTGAWLGSWLGLNLWWQVGLFIVVATIAWTGIRPFALRHLYDKVKHIKTPAEDLIGQTALVEEPINPQTGEGRVKIGAESWKATAAQALPAGARCQVEKLDGVTVTVKEI